MTMKWFYSDLLDISEADNYVEPARPVDKWTSEDLKGWLKARGFTVNGRKEELLDRVMQLKTRPEGDPPLLKNIGLDEEDARRLSVALSAMLARVMSSTIIPGSPMDLDRAIKVCFCGKV